MNYITKTNLNKKKNAVEMEEEFFRIPKSLLRSVEYKALTPAAKLIYIELLDRVGLSIMNDWTDEFGRYYVKLSKEVLPEVLGLNPKTLDRAKLQLAEFGLIEVRKVNARVHHIYVSLPNNTKTKDGN
ncbi:replication initiator protein A [Bacillus cihuensis]|uniref:replication initiator protein A n=1 Tax=Bacillus cihuensis TaxID=1208599 RepID=UPI0003F9495F|nr:replication initiator protein A [Bacillus cihuensis]